MNLELKELELKEKEVTVNFVKKFIKNNDYYTSGALRHPKIIYEDYESSGDLFIRVSFPISSSANSIWDVSIMKLIVKFYSLYPHPGNIRFNFSRDMIYVNVCYWACDPD